MDGSTISNNILRSADMENLRGLDQQATMVCNTEDGRFKYLVSTLSGTRNRAALVCLAQHPLQSCYYLPCMTLAIELLLSALYGTCYRDALICLVRHPLYSCSCLPCKWMVKTLIISRVLSMQGMVC